MIRQVSSLKDACLTAGLVGNKVVESIVPVVNSSGSILCIEMDVEAQNLSTSLHVVMSSDRVIVDFDAGVIVINGRPSKLFIPQL
jgi:hypothetical protein